MRLGAVFVGFGLTGCEAPPPDFELVALECESRARSASQGITGNVTLGTNTSRGPSADILILLNSDALSGRDPNQIYAECVERRTGAAPTRAPNL